MARHRLESTAGMHGIRSGLLCSHPRLLASCLLGFLGQTAKKLTKRLSNNGRLCSVLTDGGRVSITRCSHSSYGDN
jgi:hypothetical protein